MKSCLSLAPMLPDTLGERLRAARTDANLTQRELAHGILSTSQLSLVERGKRRPSQETLTQLADRLQCTLEALVPGRSALGRAPRECRLEQARREIQRGNFAAAERLATRALGTASNAERRIQAYLVRAEAREGMHLPCAAFADLGLALELARGRMDSRDFVSIALFRERLRHHIDSDDAA